MSIMALWLVWSILLFGLAWKLASRNVAALTLMEPFTGDDTFVKPSSSYKVIPVSALDSSDSPEDPEFMATITLGSTRSTLNQDLHIIE